MTRTPWRRTSAATSEHPEVALRRDRQAEQQAAAHGQGCHSLPEHAPPRGVEDHRDGDEAELGQEPVESRRARETLGNASLERGEHHARHGVDDQGQDAGDRDQRGPAPADDEQGEPADGEVDDEDRPVDVEAPSERLDDRALNGLQATMGEVGPAERGDLAGQGVGEDHAGAGRGEQGIDPDERGDPADRGGRRELRVRRLGHVRRPLRMMTDEDDLQQGVEHDRTADRAVNRPTEPGRLAHQAAASDASCEVHRPLEAEVRVDDASSGHCGQGGGEASVDGRSGVRVAGALAVRVDRREDQECDDQQWNQHLPRRQQRVEPEEQARAEQVDDGGQNHEDGGPREALRCQAAAAQIEQAVPPRRQPARHRGRLAGRIDRVEDPEPGRGDRGDQGPAALERQEDQPAGLRGRGAEFHHHCRDGQHQHSADQP